MNIKYFEPSKNIFSKFANLVLKYSSTPPPDWVTTPHNKSFIDDPLFLNGYNTAVKNIGNDYRIPWRVHQAIWAAHHCLNVKGDFVELGTGKGFIMQAVLASIPNWNKLDKQVWLYDTFKKFSLTGKGKAIHDQYYADDLQSVQSYFSKWNKINFIQGDILMSIIDTSPEEISFLHVDLNDGEVEVEILKKIFHKISRSGIILLDDYANLGEENSYRLHNIFFANFGYRILTTPSGQGIIIKN